MKNSSTIYLSCLIEDITGELGYVYSILYSSLSTLPLYQAPFPNPPTSIKQTINYYVFSRQLRHTHTPLNRRRYISSSQSWKPTGIITVKNLTRLLRSRHTLLNKIFRSLINLDTARARDSMIGEILSNCRTSKQIENKTAKHLQYNFFRSNTKLIESKNNCYNTNK